MGRTGLWRTAGNPTSQSIPADYWRWKSEGEEPGMRSGLGLCTGFSSTFGALFINVSNLLLSRIGGIPEELSLRLEAKVIFLV